MEWERMSKTATKYSLYTSEKARHFGSGKLKNINIHKSKLYLKYLKESKCIPLCRHLVWPNFWPHLTSYNLPCGSTAIFLFYFNVILPVSSPREKYILFSTFCALLLWPKFTLSSRKASVLIPLWDHLIIINIFDGHCTQS